jgi:apolipoprotein N-acyltransferase
MLRAALTSCRLLAGANVEREGRVTPAAVLIDMPSGRVLGHHEKQRLVPGGEFLPLLGLLPDSVARWASEVFAEAIGSAPDCVPGRVLPPLATASGVRFGSLLCYDNAFPGPAADFVRDGAVFLCVLSNEAWYRGGGELQQLVAMTVCRALELATPIVRCTTDGWSVAVGGDGRLLAELPLDPAPAASARILRVELPPGPGHLPPLAWLRSALGPAAAVLAGLAFLHALVQWARLRAARTPERGS